MLWHCWLGDRKRIRPVRTGCWFVGGDARVIAPFVTTISIILSSNIQNGDILVLANPGPPGKWPLKWREREYINNTQLRRKKRCTILPYGCGRLLYLRTRGHEFESAMWQLCTKAYSASYPSGAGQWVKAGNSQHKWIMEVTAHCGGALYMSTTFAVSRSTKWR